MIYLISKLFTAFVLPPGGIITLLVVTSFFVKRYKYIFLFFASLLYILSLSPIADFLLRPLEKPFLKKSLHVNADAVVVLGGGVRDSSIGFLLHSDAFKRGMQGLLVAKKNNLPLFYSGGGKKLTKENDGFNQTIKLLGKNLGFKTPTCKDLKSGFCIASEGKSLDTYENALFTKQSLLNEGIKNPKIALVTSAYHMRRSIKLYEHFGFDVLPCAIDFKLDDEPLRTWRDYLPDFWALQASYIALHEYAGLLSLKLRGL